MPEISETKKIMTCPRCGSEVFKVHRTGINKLMGRFVRTRQFACSSQKCSYTTVKLTKSRSKFKNPFLPISPLRNKFNMFILIIFVMIFWSFVIDMIVAHFSARPTVE